MDERSPAIDKSAPSIPWAILQPSDPKSAYHYLMFLHPHLIVNPSAAGGRAAGWWEAAAPVLHRRMPELRYTILPGRDALPAVVRQALAEGARTLIGVGGDGTHHHIVNALVQLGALEECNYAPLPLGTGNDWCRTLVVPRHLLRWMQTMERGSVIDHRIGCLTYGDDRLRYFINVAGMAYDAEVVRRAQEVAYKDRLTYPLLTAAHLPRYHPPQLTLTYDAERLTGRFHTINVGIGRYNGGGMQIVPQADPTGDRLGLTYARDLPLSRIATNSWRFFTGSIGKVRGVTTTHAMQVEVRGATGLEADGEYLGEGPVVAKLLTDRIRVHCGRPA